MIQTLREGITRPSYVRLRSFNRQYKKKDGSWGRRNTSVDLCFNIGAIRRCHLVSGDRVDLLYERYNTEWERPILIIRKGGTQRKLTGLTKDAKWISIGVGAAVKQWDLPLVVGRPLEIIDYIDNDIFIDITDVSGIRRRERERREQLKARLTYTDNGRSTTFRATQGLRDRIKAIAAREKIPANQIIIAALERYLEENYPDD